MSILPTSPFHKGEQFLQRQVGKRDKVEALGQRVIRDHLPQQHQRFYTGLNLLVIGGLDRDGKPWASLVTGDSGFVRALDERRLEVRSADLAVANITLQAGSSIGILGIDLATRRRNRVNGRILHSSREGFVLEVEQSFGNCPQYIQTRTLSDVRNVPCVNEVSSIEAQARALITKADTLFVSSFMRDANGLTHVDVSHRGGDPGFVQLADDQLIVPDYKGNNHFNTLGNFVLNPVAGVTVPDFETGRLLQMSGSVTLLESSNLAGAERAWRFTPDRVRWIDDGIYVQYFEKR